MGNTERRPCRGNGLLLIEEDVFSKQPEDSLDDFKGFMSFRRAFEEPYEFQEQSN